MAAKKKGADRAHPGIAYCAERGISKGAMKRHGYELLSRAETKRLCGVDEPSIKIPLRTPDGRTRANGAASYTLRLLPQPRPGFGGGKSDLPKFLGEKDKYNAASFSPGFDKVNGDPRKTITICESPVKATAVHEAGVHGAIGKNGIWGWRAKIHGRSVFLPDYEKINWSGRRCVELVPDSDYDDNADVRRAVAGEAAELRKRGALKVVRVVIPPGPDDEKQGVDDFIKAHGVEAYRKLLRVDVLDETLSQRVFTLDELLDDAVYVASNDTVVLLSEPWLEFKADHFRRFTKASKEKIDDKNRPAADLWMEDVRRKTAHGRTFAPGAGPVCEDPDGYPAVNTWRPVEHDAPRNWKTRAKPFVDHLHYLVPDAAEREQVSLWFAHAIQHPGEMPPWHVLMYTDGAQGVGRNWLAAAVGRMLQPYAALNLDISVLAGTERGSGFNGVLAGRVFACVDEIQASAFARGGRRMMETLKTTLTAEYRDINPKYGGQGREFNRLRVLVLSNHVDAMPLDLEDRRWLVIKNPDRPRDEKYYASLYESLDDPEFIAAAWRYLSSLDVSKLKRGHAPPSTAKAALFEATEPEHVAAVRAVVENEDRDLITTSALKMKAEIEDSWKIREAMRAVGAVKFPQKVRVRTWDREGKRSHREHVWILRNHEQWMRAPADRAAEHLARRGKTK